MSTRPPGSGAPGAPADLAADVSVQGRAVMVRIKGLADHRSQAHLVQFLDRVHKRALEVGAHEAVVDLTDLRFMSSSCLAELMGWIEAVQSSTPPYLIRFVTNFSHRWQARSLEALRCLARDIVSLTRS